MSARDRIRRPEAGSARLGPFGLLLLAMAGLVLPALGCGGGSAGQAPPAADVTGRRAPVARPPEPIPTKPGEEVFNVTVYSTGGEIYVDKLEVEFNRRRGIHAIYGFYRDQWTEMATVPFADLKRIDFEGQMPASLYDQAMIGREAMTLSRDYAFQVELTYKDDRREEFFALIPKLRGEKDFVLWELGMSSAAKQIDYIEFNR